MVLILIDRLLNTKVSLAMQCAMVDRQGRWYKKSYNEYWANKHDYMING